MTQIVVDASTIGNAILAEVPPSRIDQIEAVLGKSDLVQPRHWPIEIVGFVLKASRRKRLDVADQNRARDSVFALAEVAIIDEKPALPAIFDLAVEHHISLYDACYLELAVRKNLPLLTSDGPLAKAALKSQIKLIEIE